jgi:hypothetical protein
MNQPVLPERGEVSTIIESERKRDRLVRRVSFIAWGVTLAVMLIFAGIVGADVANTIARVRAGAAGSNSVLHALIPLLGVVGGTSLLLALVSTVGVFLRFRTASLADIQLRLAILESMLSEESGTEEAS